jgi:CheY-like chemotaxis protein
MQKLSRKILVIEDSPEDFDLTVRAFAKAGFTSALRRCSDGQEAMNYLRRQGEYADPATAPRPDVILLDLNLPGTDGREILQELKTDQDLKTIPVIVVTTSRDERDVALCYNSGANSFVHKSVNLEGFFNSIRSLSDFWFSVALLPS